MTAAAELEREWARWRRVLWQRGLRGRTLWKASRAKAEITLSIKKPQTNPQPKAE